MESRIKGLRTLLIIGTVIVFLAGFAFLFASSISPIIRTCTMIVISIVLMGLSLYEENTLKFKSDSIVSYIIGNVGIMVAYISTYVNDLLSGLFNLANDDFLLFVSLFFVLLGLLLLVSIVKYKLYKLLELVVFAYIIALGFFLTSINVDEYLVVSIILGLVFIKNLIKMSNFSEWISLVFTFLSLFFIGNNNVLFAYIIGTIGIANMFVVLFKDKSIQMVPIILMSLITINMFVGVSLDVSIVLTAGLLSLIEMAVNKFNLIDSKIRVFDKAVFVVSFLFIVSMATTNNVYCNCILPLILLGSGLINKYVLKDPYEKYVLPFKLFYCIDQLTLFIPYDGMEYVGPALICISMLVAYMLTKSAAVKRIYMVLIFLSNVVLMLDNGSNLILSIILMILSLISFYVIYVSDSKIEKGLSAYFIFMSAVILAIMSQADNLFLLISAICYAIYLAITKKNKVIFGASLIMFLVASSYYTLNIIDVESIATLIIEMLILCGILLFGFVCVTEEKNQVLFLSLAVMAQIIITIIMHYGLILRIFALIEALGLIIYSINKNKHTLPYIGGIVLTALSLLHIMASFDNLPIALYLIIIGLIIIISAPIAINGYMKKMEQIKIEEAKKPKPKKTVKYCSECGTKADDTDKFCGKCGNKIK